MWSLLLHSVSLYLCTFAALLIMNLLEILCWFIVFFRISLDPLTNLILWVSGSMAIITCHIKKSLNKVPVDISLSLSLQTCQPAAVRGMASTSSMQFTISSMTSVRLLLPVIVISDVNAFALVGRTLARHARNCYLYIIFIVS